MTTEERYQMIYGNAARSIEPEPELEPKPESKPKKKVKKKVNKQEAAMKKEWLNLRVYVAVIVLAIVGIGYVSLLLGNVVLREEIATLTNDLNNLEIDNKELEKTIQQQLDYTEIKRRARNELGMVEAKKSHVIEYTNNSDDYVRQFGSVAED